MPELPEVETVLRTLEHQIKGCQINDVDIRWPRIIDHPTPEGFKERIIGQRFERFERLGKYLIFGLGDLTLICHMRMEGKFYIEPAASPVEKHTHVIFWLEDGRQLRYNDTRKFGRMDLYGPGEAWTALKHVGLDPWDVRLTSAYLEKQLSRRRITLKQALLDQQVIAGIGNIYADEICFACHLSPLVETSKLKLADYEMIIVQTRRILKAAIAAGGTTIRSYTSSLGVTGRFQQSLMVHTRDDQPCYECGCTIVKTRVGGRGTYYCPGCQKDRQ